jgi:hypothetical protein
MTRSRIGGTLDLSALTRLMHRPTDPATLSREARELIARGMTVPDAAQAFALTPRALADLLAQQETTP